MNPSHRRVVFLLAVTTVWAAGCGPFFPDTVLDIPQAALRVRSSCFLDDIIEIDRAAGRGLSNTPRGRAMIEKSHRSRTRDWQLSEEELDRRDLQEAMAPVIAAGMPAKLAQGIPFGSGQTRTEMIDLACVLLERKVNPPRVAEIVTACAKWRAAMLQVSLEGPCAVATPVAAEIPAPPAFPELPPDIRAYWLAALEFHSGKLDAARAAWREILDLPADQRQHRGVWAVWMLAKTSADLAQALPFYQETCALAAAGGRDVLGLAPAALGWRAFAESDPVAALKMYFEAACSGDESMLVSLRQRCADVLDGDDDLRARAAADPLAREIVTATLFATLDGPYGVGDTSDPRSLWLDLLEKHPAAKASPSAAKAAWLCYGTGDFDAARRWLKQAPADSGEVLWLQAKLALRDGQLDQAARLFARAAPFYQFAKGEVQAPEPHIDELRWFEHSERRDWMRGQFHTDRAITHVARGEFLRALGFLHKANYHADAAYLAERVLTTDELVGWVKANCPKPKDPQNTATFWISPDGRVHAPNDEGWWSREWIGDPLRYVLARRLAREFRFREAAEFMPPALQPMFEHYVKLHRAARSKRWQGDTQAVILWNLAKLRRHLGLELFGYEGAPDNTNWGGNFEATQIRRMRLQPIGWRADWDEERLEVGDPLEDKDRAIPQVSEEELRRLTKNTATFEKRFHYRYEAAEIAWQAAALLPDTHPGTLFLLHEAGRWLAARDPQAADRFYQEIVRRCSATPKGQELDLRRWFFPEAPPSGLPDLPAELRFSQPEVASRE